MAGCFSTPTQEAACFPADVLAICRLLAVQTGVSSGSACNAGLDVQDAGSGEHVLRACALPDSALEAAKPFICRYHPLSPLTEVYGGSVLAWIALVYTSRININT